MTYFGVEDPAVALAEMQHASDSKHCRGCGDAYVYETVYLGHLGVYRCPGCGRQRPEPDVFATADRAARHALRVLQAVDPGRRGGGRTRPARASTTSTTRSQRPRCRLALGRLARRHRRRPAERRRGLRPGRSGSTVGDVELSILLIKNPAGANEVLRTLSLEEGELDLLLDPQRPHRRRARCLLDLGRRLRDDRPRVRQRDVLGHPGARSSRCASSTPACRRTGSSVRDRALAQALDAALASAADGRLFALPTYTALLELREELSARGHVATFWREREPAMSERGHLARDRMRRLHADLPFWLELAAERGGPVLDVGAGTGRVTLELARSGHAVVALDRDPDLLRRTRRDVAELPVRSARAFAPWSPMPGRSRSTSCSN